LWRGSCKVYSCYFTLWFPMYKILPTLAFLFMVVVYSLPAQLATDATIQRALEKQVKAMVDSFLKEDIATFVKYIYPPIVKQMGGKKKMIKSLTESMKSMRDRGVTITEFSVSEPTAILKVGKHLQCTIPLTIEVKTPLSRVKTESTLIGVSTDSGRNWLFIDTSDKDRDSVKKFLPNLSDDLVIPEAKTTELKE
jgi:hypothetical protein